MKVDLIDDPFVASLVDTAARHKSGYDFARDSLTRTLYRLYHQRYGLKAGDYVRCRVTGLEGKLCFLREGTCITLYIYTGHGVRRGPFNPTDVEHVERPNKKKAKQ